MVGTPSMEFADPPYMNIRTQITICTRTASSTRLVLASPTQVWAWCDCSLPTETNRPKRNGALQKRMCCTKDSCVTSCIGQVALAHAFETHVIINLWHWDHAVKISKIEWSLPSEADFLLPIGGTMTSIQYCDLDLFRIGLWSHVTGPCTVELLHFLCHPKGVATTPNWRLRARPREEKSGF